MDKKTQLKGYNCFINDNADDEYETDLAFIKLECNTHILLVMLDIFIKYATAIEIPSKETPDVIAGIMEGFIKMGKKPKRIYSDNEGAIKWNLFEKYCNKNNIQLIFTRTHAWAVERFIRTLRDKILKSVEYDKSKDFNDVLFEVLLTYNNRDVHTSTGLTPNDARQDHNRLQVLTIT